MSKSNATFLFVIVSTFKSTYFDLNLSFIKCWKIFWSAIAKIKRNCSSSILLQLHFEPVIFQWVSLLGFFIFNLYFFPWFKIFPGHILRRKYDRSQYQLYMFCWEPEWTCPKQRPGIFQKNSETNSFASPVLLLKKTEQINLNQNDVELSTLCSGLTYPLPPQCGK